VTSGGLRGEDVIRLAARKPGRGERSQHRDKQCARRPRAVYSDSQRWNSPLRQYTSTNTPPSNLLHLDFILKFCVYLSLSYGSYMKHFILLYSVILIISGEEYKL
jgi:hypothetical protein